MKRVSVVLELCILFLSVAAVARMEAFPGLDAAIDKAAVVVVVTVESNLDISAWGNTISEEPYTTHQCLVLTSLKGTLVDGSRIHVALRPPADLPPGAPPAVAHRYLVFLEQVGTSKTWRSLDFPGCVLPVSPEFDKTRLTDATPKAKVQRIIRQFLEWRDRHTEMQTKNLERLLKE